MPRVCILTDSTAQFTSPHFPGDELVTVLPMRIQLNQQIFLDSKEINLGQLPSSARDEHNPRLLPPAEDNFRRTLKVISKRCQDILVILHSGQLSATISEAYRIVSSTHSSAEIHIIDSQTIGTGLGLIIQEAAQAATNGSSVAEIKPLLNRLIPRVYTIYCTQSLTYLYQSGQLDAAQATVGEMLGLTAFFALENGGLVPLQKAKNSRNMLDIFEEFIVEFHEPQHISTFQGLPPFTHEIRSLHERIHEQFPHAPYSESALNTACGLLLGPRSLGIVTMTR
jgi:DegV family protein with EDD domain